MIQITVDIPEGSSASLHKDPESFAREMRIAAAVQWYAKRALSQERAAEDPARKALAAGWGGTRVPIQPDADSMKWGLGPGECSVLTLARSMIIVPTNRPALAPTLRRGSKGGRSASRGA